MWTDEELNRLIAETDDTGMQARLREILRMEGPERDAAIDALTTAYDPMRDDLRSEIERNYSEYTKEGPQGIQAASNNPYSVYIAANPLEHAASAYMRGKAGKEMKEQRKQLNDLSEQESTATKGVMNAQIELLRRKIDEENRRKAGFGVF